MHVEALTSVPSAGRNEAKRDEFNSDPAEACAEVKQICADSAGLPAERIEKKEKRERAWQRCNKENEAKKEGDMGSMQPLNRRGEPCLLHEEKKEASPHCHA